MVAVEGVLEFSGRRMRRLRWVERSSATLSSSAESSEWNDGLRPRPPPRTMPGGGVGSGGWFSGLNRGFFALFPPPRRVRSRCKGMLLSPINISSLPKPFMPSTSASIVPTSATGAATTTAGRRYPPKEAPSTGVRGGVSICVAVDDAEMRRYGGRSACSSQPYVSRVAIGRERARATGVRGEP